nr:LysM peptidoglycan-binding domain-containing protein [uncultured Desulfobulbus sp.]
MKLLPVLLPPCCAVLLCFSLSSCSSPNKQHLTVNGLKQATVCTVDEEIALSEPEETATEELAALKGLSAEQRTSLEQAGIDASKYDFPIVLNEQVQYYLDLFQGKQRRSYARWLARSMAYRPYIEPELVKAGLPKDLVFLAMIESGYNPRAYSPAHACGLWQFIAPTGRTYGLTINSWIDERREPVKATRAAIGYLSKLHNQFDNWYLAVAAYNTGERRIADAIEAYDTKDFWTIADTERLYQETKRYVPKLIAAIIIGRDPEKFGFTDIKYHSPQPYEEISVPGGASLSAVAVIANTSVKALRELNTELKLDHTPPRGRYSLRIPPGTKKLVAANINNLKPVKRTVYASHTVRRGDTLSAICQRYNVSLHSLRKANNMRSSSFIRIGQRLRVPTYTTRYVLASQDRPQRSSQSTRTVQQSMHHRVEANETLGSVARRYKVSVEDLMRWNKLSNPNTLRQGQQLAVYVSSHIPKAVLAQAPSASPQTIKLPKAALAIAPTTTKAESKTQTAASKQASSGATVAKGPAKATWYVIQRGDTLSTIARRFKTSTKDLRKLNKLSDNLLRTGNKLLIKKG